MQLELYTSGGFIRRWRRNALGACVCSFDAVDPQRLADGGAAILTATEALQAEENAVVALEDAVRCLAGDEPEKTITTTNEDGEPVTIPNPDYEAWEAALALYASASPELMGLATLRAGEYPLGEDGQPIIPVDDPGPDTLELLPPPSKAVTYKSDIFARATDDETVAIKAGVDAMGPKLAAFFDAVVEIRHAHPLFAQLKAGFIQAFQEPRALELLAPSQDD